LTLKRIEEVQDIFEQINKYDESVQPR